MTRVLMLVLAGSFAGCATTAASTTQAITKELTASDFYPLAVGNRWVYDSNMLGEKGTDEIKLVREAEGFIVDSNDSKLAADAYGVRDDKRYLLRNPVALGTRWTNVVSVSSVERYEIISAGQPCDAPAGSFENCVVVQSKNRVKAGLDLVMEMTFAPKVGIVRIITELDDNGRRVRQTSRALVSWTLGAPPARR